MLCDENDHDLNESFVQVCEILLVQLPAWSTQA